MCTEARSFQSTVVNRVQGRYLAAFPGSYRRELDRQWPLLLFLHGADERGIDLEHVTRHGPLASSSPEELPFVIVAPQCPGDAWWRPHALYALLRTCHERYRVDPTRFYGTGISMGGTGLWMLAASYPDLFAAVVPICGRADPLWAPSLVDTAVWAIHGAQDATIPPEQSRTIVDAIQNEGGNALLTIDPEARHDVWTDIYARREIYEWLLSHERTTAAF